MPKNLTHLSAQAFEGEVSFVRNDNYLNALVSIQVGEEGELVPFKRSTGNAQLFATLAALAERQEDKQGPELSLDNVKLFAAGYERDTQYPVEWLRLEERKKFSTKRSCHAWCINLDEGKLWLHFEHGEYGFRRERFDRWSKCFARLSTLLSGAVTWHEFGDAESARTLLGKGQFYWDDPEAQRMVPVDNFVFLSKLGAEYRVSGVSHQCVIDVLLPGGATAFEWFNDYAEALLRLADLLEGRVDIRDFGVSQHPMVNEHAQRLRATSPDHWPGVQKGHFVVKRIYSDDDVHDAPKLLYRTAEGHQVILEASTSEIGVQFCTPKGTCRLKHFEPGFMHDALRRLAYELQGGDEWPEANA